MADIHVHRIVNAIQKLFEGQIDLADYLKKSTDERNAAFVTRGLAAYAILAISACTVAEAAASVTDGFDDCGIDSVHFDRATSTLYFCQSKYHRDGKGSISQGDILKFISGCKKLLNLDFTGLNAKHQAKLSEVREAVLNTDVSIRLLICHTGVDSLAQEPETELQRFVEEINNPSPVMTSEVLSQSDLYSLVQAGHQRADISLTISLSNWGFLAEPFEAYYGNVAARDIYQWWQQHESNLLIRNIRNFKGRTDVNDALVSTIKGEPSHFWYFNNGIILLCNSVKKAVLGGSGRDSAIFECSGVSVVNGAQTVGSIGRSADSIEEIDEGARVHVRLVSLENCPAEFDQRMTRATNTQNRIEGRDFAALDPNQRRLASEFYLDGLRYAYKSGEPEPLPHEGCTLTEATIALACSHSNVAYSTQVKNQIGRIFDDLSSPPYTDLFNDTIDSRTVWRVILALRAIDNALELYKTRNESRALLVATHANRFIAHRTFQNSNVRATIAGRATDEEIAAATAEKAEIVFCEVADYLNCHETQSYLAPLFKNRSRCRDLEHALNTGILSTAEPESSDDTLFEI